jgi:hypothetical protein
LATTSGSGGKREAVKTDRTSFFTVFGVITFTALFVVSAGAVAWKVTGYLLKPKKKVSGQVVDLTGVRFDKKA